MPIPRPPRQAGRPRAPSHNLTLRVASARCWRRSRSSTAYLGGWPFALFWAVAAVAVLVGMAHAGRRAALPDDGGIERRRHRGGGDGWFGTALLQRSC